jgi:hypothetical protein
MVDLFLDRRDRRFGCRECPAYPSLLGVMTAKAIENGDVVGLIHGPGSTSFIDLYFSYMAVLIGWRSARGSNW